MFAALFRRVIHLTDGQGVLVRHPPSKVWFVDNV